VPPLSPISLSLVRFVFTGLGNPDIQTLALFFSLRTSLSLLFVGWIGIKRLSITISPSPLGRTRLFTESRRSESSHFRLCEISEVAKSFPLKFITDFHLNSTRVAQLDFQSTM